MPGTLPSWLYSIACKLPMLTSVWPLQRDFKNCTHIVVVTLKEERRYPGSLLVIWVENRASPKRWCCQNLCGTNFKIGLSTFNLNLTSLKKKKSSNHKIHKCIKRCQMWKFEDRLLWLKFFMIFLVKTWGVCFVIWNTFREKSPFCLKLKTMEHERVGEEKVHRQVVCYLERSSSDFRMESGWPHC